MALRVACFISYIVTNLITSCRTFFLSPFAAGFYFCALVLAYANEPAQALLAFNVKEGAQPIAATSLAGLGAKTDPPLASPSAENTTINNSPPQQKNSTPGKDRWRRFWDFLSIGRDGRHKFGIGLGVSGAFFSYYNNTWPVQNAIENRISLINGVFLQFYAKFNLIDMKYFFLSIGMSYNDEHLNQLATGERMSAAFDSSWLSSKGQEFSHSSIFYVSSATTFRLDVGSNIGRFFTLYSIFGVSGLYLHQSYRIASLTQGSISAASGDYFDAFPALGLGLEIRLHDRLGAKLEFTTTFIDRSLAPTFPNYLYNEMEALYISNLTFGLHLYL